MCPPQRAARPAAALVFATRRPRPTVAARSCETLALVSERTCEQARELRGFRLSIGSVPILLILYPRLTPVCLKAAPQSRERAAHISIKLGCASSGLDWGVGDLMGRGKLAS
jgi:hypothetical protein